MWSFAVSIFCLLTGFSVAEGPGNHGDCYHINTGIMIGFVVGDLLLTLLLLLPVYCCIHQKSAKKKKKKKGIMDGKRNKERFNLENKEKLSDSENNQPMEQKLPSEVVGAPSLETFKKRLDSRLSEMVVGLPLGLGLDDLQEEPRSYVNMIGIQK